MKLEKIPLVIHVVLIFLKKKMGDFEDCQEPTEVQIFKLRLKLCRKNQKCIFVIALNRKILYMRFLTAQLKRTLIKKS